jgi:L-alanine-DL-glutamate epimerase-like enolase superfamily enzyme
MSRPDAAVGKVGVRAFRIPTDAPEADGTISWDATTLVLVELEAGGRTGIGYSYAAGAAAEIVRGTLSPLIEGTDAFDISGLWKRMVEAVRNVGWRGVSACAISAVDWALWDLKANLLELPLVKLLGAERRSVPIYGSGGFTSYDDERLTDQLGNWVRADGCRAVKMKIGSHPDDDLRRVRVAHAAIDGAELYVDANGALGRKKALWFAERFSEYDVTWFEEPVSSDDLDGLRLLRDRCPAGMDIAACEYGYEPFYFRRMLEAGAVDVLQADGTRCCGLTGFLRAAALADAHGMPLSAHTAPALHLHAGCAAPRFKNIEWFHDHVRIERMLFDGAAVPKNGQIFPDLSRSGLGLSFKEKDAERFAV